jgi:golgi apparatus protein 1
MSCGGRVLRCLTEKQDDIVSKECQAEVFYFEKMEVNDYRNDVLLAEACRRDVDKFCSNVQKGEKTSAGSML